MNWKDNCSKENIYFQTDDGILYCNDVIEQLLQFPDESIDCVITSPPYWALRDYGVDGQIGLEPTFQEYLEKLWGIFSEIYRILKSTGTCWVVMGDTYANNTKAGNKVFGNPEFNKNRPSRELTKIPQKRVKGIKRKSLCMIPERFAIGMIERGWILRNQIIWHKPNAMPQSVKDRFTVDFEKIFFFVKQKKYYFKQILETYAKNTLLRMRYKRYRETSKGGNKIYSVVTETYHNGNGRNKRTIWSISTKPFKEAHFAVFPPEIPELCIQAGCPEDGIVLDPFFGAGTVGVVAEKMKRNWIGIEINKEYCEIAKERILKELK